MFHSTKITHSLSRGGGEERKKILSFISHNSRNSIHFHLLRCVTVSKFHLFLSAIALVAENIDIIMKFFFFSLSPLPSPLIFIFFFCDSQLICVRQTSMNTTIMKKKSPTDNKLLFPFYIILIEFIVM